MSPTPSSSATTTCGRSCSGSAARRATCRESQAGGNPFEAPRGREYPLPPLTPILSSVLFTEAARSNGFHPFPRPSANASRAYTNPDGSQYGACQYCGYCQRFGCEANAKGSPTVTVIPMALKNPSVKQKIGCLYQGDVPGVISPLCER